MQILLHTREARTGLRCLCYPKCWTNSSREYMGDKGKDCFLIIEGKKRKKKRKTHFLTYGQYVLFHTINTSTLTLKVNQKPGPIEDARDFALFFTFFLAVNARSQYHIVYLYFSSPKQVCSDNRHCCGFPAAHLHPAGVHCHPHLEIKEQTLL